MSKEHYPGIDPTRQESSEDFALERQAERNYNAVALEIIEIAEKIFAYERGMKEKADTQVINIAAGYYSEEAHAARDLGKAEDDLATLEDKWDAIEDEMNKRDKEQHHA
jgi:hypothetical protein